MRKGVVEIQFNWIFVLIVGAVLMTFFGMIIVSQKRTAETKLSVSTLGRIDSILTGAGVSANTMEMIRIPDIVVDYDGTQLLLGGVSRSVGERILFAPSRIADRTLITWTQDWKVPFKVANFLYITGANIDYVFIDGSGGIESVYSNFPDNITSEYLNSSPYRFTDKGYNQYRFILSNKEPLFDNGGIETQFIKKMPDADVTALKVVNESGILNVTFYRKKDDAFENLGSRDVLPGAMLYAAIFSDSPEIYDLVMGRASATLYTVASIYKSKESMIRNVTLLNKSMDEKQAERCATLTAASSINKIKSAASSDGQIDVNGLPSEIQSIQSVNKQNLKNSCPPIY